MPVRQWVLSLPIPLRLLLAAQPELVTPVLQVVHRVITRHLLGQAGLKAEEAYSCAVTLILRFGSAANLNIHVHCLVLERVQTNAAGQVVLKLKTAWRDGTTHLVMSPLEFMQRLAALVPRPRLHLIRFHGVLVPNAKLRALVVPQEVPQEVPQVPEPASKDGFKRDGRCVSSHAAEFGVPWGRKRTFEKPIPLARVPVQVGLLVLI